MISLTQHRWAIGTFGPNKKVKLKIPLNTKNQCNFKTTIAFIFWCLLGSMGYYGHSLYLKNSSNKHNHSKYGNIVKDRNNFKFLHWNKGNSNFQNKLNDIYSTIQGFSPDIFSIVEANFNISSNIKFKDYNLEYSKLHPLSNNARTILLVKNNIPFTRRYDIESPLISSVWIEIAIIKSNRLLVCSYYCQWSLPSELNIPNSSSETSQISRYIY